MAFRGVNRWVVGGNRVLWYSIWWEVRGTDLDISAEKVVVMISQLVGG